MLLGNISVTEIEKYWKKWTGVQYQDSNSNSIHLVYTSDLCPNPTAPPRAASYTPWGGGEGGRGGEGKGGREGEQVRERERERDWVPLLWIIAPFFSIGWFPLRSMCVS